MNDSTYMRRAIYLAKLAGPGVKMNPPVGAVIVAHDEVIGEGFTQPIGGPHAEVMAIQNVSVKNEDRLSQATIYVTLEPCNHFGKTPPCADLIIKHQIKKVVISQIDPNPKVNGTGISKLRAAGIDVVTGVLSEESEYPLRPFKKWMKYELPYITLKWAQSKDRFFGKADQQIWLSNPYSKIFAHKLRSQHDAILVGTDTILVDEPALNNRLWAGPSPTRVVVNRNGRIPNDHPFFKMNIPTVIYSEKENPFANHNPHLIWQQLPKIKDDLETVFQDLGEKGLVRILVEGGAKIHKSLIKSNKWDEAIVIRTPIVLASGINAPVASGHLKENYMLDDNEVLHILNRDNNA